MTLKFEKYHPKDFKLYYDIVKKDEVMKYVFGRGMTTEEASLKFDSVLKINAEQATLGYFMVLDSETNEVMGDSKLVPCTHREQALEIGYLLKQTHWRKGIGSTICQHLLAMAKELHPTYDVIAVIDPDNLASRNLLHKFGFQSYWKGVEHDLATEKLILKK